MAKHINFGTESEHNWKYHKPAIWLHWVSALLIIGLLCVGWYMMSIEDEPGSGWYFDQHKSFGILVLILILIRIVWRIRHKPEPLSDNVPGWQKNLASIIQWLLYGSMFAMPIIGFIGTSYTKRGVSLFGMKLPAWTTPNHDIAEQFFAAHSILAFILTTLIVLHVLAGLKHLFIDRDRVFYRMWF
ncbi:cytochrome b [Undibacterium sp. RTI2.1]|uniref:cytochrome b n=1 Tax=unclassified Undibacterium TaxID=2630295 RepID=UPI002AB59C52|nr:MULTISPECIES: cytochrome b [unclassified Undibacterium]MDY7540711.1 cytochrome b [Undibacterium sp. 5I1]MEB0033095.1 cytochrome b [Undibacterium sp. RTI2.1]MEB0118949.1 cytochrome b [Undibacterium sp. RTI2.2]MEB0233024.1 cytochrome b [Undibacterium sp. 10I3]MEB0259779.1 cytochrome b [Undibacterium sp. 5I1]